MITNEDVIRTKNLEIIDDQGRRRIWIKCDGPSAAPSVALFDESGYERLGLFLDKSGFPGVRLLDQSGSSYAGVGVQQDFTVVTISRPDGTVAIRIALGLNNYTQVEILDDEGQRLLSCGGYDT